MGRKHRQLRSYCALPTALGDLRRPRARRQLRGGRAWDDEWTELRDGRGRGRGSARIHDQQRYPRRFVEGPQTGPRRGAYDRPSVGQMCVVDHPEDPWSLHRRGRILYRGLYPQNPCF